MYRGRLLSPISVGLLGTIKGCFQHVLSPFNIRFCRRKLAAHRSMVPSHPRAQDAFIRHQKNKLGKSFGCPRAIYNEMFTFRVIQTEPSSSSAVSLFPQFVGAAL